MRGGREGWGCRYGSLLPSSRLSVLLKPADGQEYKDLLVTGDTEAATGADGGGDEATNPPVRYYFGQ